MAGVCRIVTDGLLEALHACFSYEPGANRATGYLYVRGEQDWPPPLAECGPRLLEEVGPFDIVAFQAYRNGSGCGLHVDGPFADQLILSLGVTRSFWLDGETLSVSDGDLVSVPESVEHGVPEEAVPGERCSLVFRNRRKP